MAEECTTIDCCLPDSFANPVEPDTGNFEVSVTIEGDGEVSGDGEHEELSEVTLVATPGGGSSFVAWKDANGFVLSEEEEWTFTITGNMLIVAEFI